MIQKYAIIYIIIMIGLGDCVGQTYRKVFFEPSAAYVHVSNMRKVVSEIQSTGFSSTMIVIDNESSIYSTRYGFSLGYQIDDRHALSIQMRRGTIGTSLTGSAAMRDDTGATTTFLLDRSKNLIAYRSIGLQYSYAVPLDEDYLLFSLGGSYQRNGYENTVMIVDGIRTRNVNAEVSLGFRHQLLPYLDLIPKFIVVRSFEGGPPFSTQVSYQSQFVPLQYGVEMAIRLRLDG